MDLLTTAELAEYLRLKERKVYDLVAQGAVPHIRVTGKILFPRALVDRWLLQNLDGPDGLLAQALPPPIVAGSHDPLLDWALREAGGGLATLIEGSRAGLERLAAGQALVAACHLLDPADGSYTVHAVRTLVGLPDLVVLEWARRHQGLIVPPGNPQAIRDLADCAARRLPFAGRQRGAGAEALLLYLLDRAGLAPTALTVLPQPCLTEMDVGIAVQTGRAACGLGIEAVARALGLGFVPLHQERFDLVLRRRDAFEPPLQRLLAFARTAAFHAEADRLGGYDLSGLGTVHYNA